MPSRSAPASGRSGRSSTARTSPTRRRRNRPHIPPDAARVIIGLVCMLLGVATLIALLLPSQGRLTDMWRDSIAPWVGFGRWLLPFLLLALGWWMVERAKSVRGDWELTAAGAAAGLCAALGLVELAFPKHGGIIGKALVVNLPPLITTPGTALLLTAIMIAGFLLAMDRSLPAAVSPIASLTARAVEILSRPAPARNGVQAAGASTSITSAAGTERLQKAGKDLPPERVPGAAKSVPVAIPSQGPISATFAPPAPVGFSRDGSPLGEVPAGQQASPRDGGSVRDGIPVRGAGTGAAGQGNGSAADTGEPGSELGLTLGLAPVKPRPEYRLPPLALLEDIKPTLGDTTIDHQRNAAIIEAKLASFNIPAQVVAWNAGPVVTQYEVAPSPDIKVSRIEALSDDLAMALAARTIRIEAPIPGKSVVGIEVPNKDFNIVALRRILEEVDLRGASKLTFALGRDVAGHARAADLAKMPHMLIAGATGSGKSVMVNALITSLLCNATPDEVRLILVDLKRVELSAYNGLPHLMVPVITEPERAKAALTWAVAEMETRYRRFAGATARNLAGFNDGRADPADRLPYLVIIIDELADLMMREGKNVEEPIVRLAQKARATGIHMVLATQRPSVNVVTGLIKANFPSRIAFAMASQIDSRTILDMPGAEDLIGRGDMLFQPADLPRPIRLQGVFVSDKEIGNVCEHWRAEAEPHYDMGIIESAETSEPTEHFEDQDADRLLLDAVGVVQEYDRASASLLQRRLKIGYARAARIVDQLEARGYIGPFDGSNARQVLRRDVVTPARPTPGQEDEE
ncbi:MAG TPA: DNA translocase FtsK [Candidatus Limnocylindrales bacterium]